MASFVIYKLSGATEADQRQEGMKDIGNAVHQKMGDPANGPKQILTETLDFFVNSPLYKVTFTDKNGEEYKLTFKNSGSYEYDRGVSPLIDIVKVQVNAHEDKENNSTVSMNLVTPEDPVDISTNSYIASVISDLGGQWSANAASYYLGTIMFRRCR